MKLCGFFCSLGSLLFITLFDDILICHLIKADWHIEIKQV